MRLTTLARIALRALCLLPLIVVGFILGLLLGLILGPCFCVALGVVLWREWRGANK